LHSSWYNQRKQSAAAICSMVFSIVVLNFLKNTKIKLLT
jgi:hypothetical protein